MIYLVCPQCNRRVAAAPLMRSATIQVQRTCRRCRTRWLVLLIPIKESPAGVITRAEWVAQKKVENPLDTSP